MADEITPQAKPIVNTGEPEWFPPPQDDKEMMPAPEPSGIRRVFYGKDGLRAGWSILIFLLITAAISAALFQLFLAMGLLHRGGSGSHEIPVKATLLGDGAQLVAVGLAAFAMTFLENRRFGVYGLGSLVGRGGQFAYGVVLGFTTLSLLVAGLWASHLLTFGGFLLHGAAALHWGLMWALGFLVVGLFEEFLSRGYLQFTLSRGIAGTAGAAGMSEPGRRALGFWLAAVIFSFLFGLGHKNNPGESPIGVVAAGLIGLVFAFSLWRTGSLWWAVGWHAAWDWAESFFYGTADSGGISQHRLLVTHPQGSPLMSGGLTGPEGSVYVLIAIALTVALIALTLKPQPGSPAAAFAASR